MLFAPVYLKAFTDPVARSGLEQEALHKTLILGTPCHSVFSLVEHVTRYRKKSPRKHPGRFVDLSLQFFL